MQSNGPLAVRLRSYSQGEKSEILIKYKRMKWTPSCKTSLSLPAPRRKIRWKGIAEQRARKRKKNDMVHCKRVHTCLLHVRNADPSLKHKILKWTPYGLCIKDFRLGIKYKIIKSTWYGISVRKVYGGKSSYTTYTWNHCLFFWAWKKNTSND